MIGRSPRSVLDVCPGSGVPSLVTAECGAPGLSPRIAVPSGGYRWRKVGR